MSTLGEATVWVRPEYCDVVCLGEVLFDLIGRREFPGGSPANVAFHAAALGSRSSLISRVGMDVRGARLVRWLEDAGVGIGGMQTDPQADTGVVRVAEGTGGPAYEIAAPVAWDFLEATAESDALAKAARVLVFGTLAQRRPESRAAVRRLVLAARAAGAKVVADLNLRPPFHDEEVVLWTVRNCDVLKLNEGELAVVSEMLGARGGQRELFEGFVGEFGLASAVLTCGAEGAWFHEAGTTWHVPPVAAEVADTVGAGDAFTAAMASALASGKTLGAAGPWCARVAAHVVSQSGATPRLPDGMVSQWLREMAGS